MTTSNLDAVRAMVHSTAKVRDVLPQARIVWLLNERLGPIFPANFEAALVGLTAGRFAELRAGVTEITFPRMTDQLWQPIDRAGLNLVDFVKADPASLAKYWVDNAGNRLDASSAAVVQRRISGWIAKLMEAASQAVRFLPDEHDI